MDITTELTLTHDLKVGDQISIMGMRGEIELIQKNRYGGFVLDVQLLDCKDNHRHITTIIIGRHIPVETIKEG